MAMIGCLVFGVINESTCNAKRSVAVIHPYCRGCNQWMFPLPTVTQPHKLTLTVVR